MRKTDIYPTRGAEERIIERQDPVVYGEAGATGEFSLNTKQLKYYEDNGFIIFPELFSADEVDAMRQEYRRVLKGDLLKGRDELITEPESDEVRSIFSLEKFSPLFDKISRDGRILEKVMQILGSQVYIHHSRINIKPAYYGKSFPWHSDFETWHAEDGIPRLRMLTAWIMLTENSQFNGPLYLIPGSHKQFVSCQGETPEKNFQQSLKKQEYGVPSEAAIRELVQGSRLAGAYGKPGTLVIHEGNIMHGSPDNISPWPRSNLFFVYNSIYNQPADTPFGAEKLRPEFLSNPDRTPLFKEAT
jgi:ectoine hydroxylase